MTACLKIANMGYFEERLTEFIAESGISIHKAALSIGVDPGNMHRALYNTKFTKLEKRLEVVRDFVSSPLVEGKLSYPEAAAWMMEDYIPADVFNALVQEKLKRDPALLKLVEKHKND